MTSIEDLELENLCNELGLDETLIPSHTMSQHLVDMVRGLDYIELSTLSELTERWNSKQVDEN